MYRLKVPGQIQLMKFGYFSAIILNNKIRYTNELPRKEVHAGELGEVWFGYVYIERLTLVNVCSAVGSHLNNILLR